MKEKFFCSEDTPVCILEQDQGIFFGDWISFLKKALFMMSNNNSMI